MNLTKIVCSIMLLTIQFGFSQSRITGKVSDSNNTPIQGANIIIKGQQQNGITSGSDGNFNIEVKENGSYEIQISYIGYETFNKELTAKNNQNIDLGTISLIESIESLQSVEITGRKR